MALGNLYFSIKNNFSNWSSWTSKPGCANQAKHTYWLYQDNLFWFNVNFHSKQELIVL